MLPRFHFRPFTMLAALALITLACRLADQIGAQPVEFTPTSAASPAAATLAVEITPGRAVQLRLLPEQLSGAPVLPTGQPLTPTDWEAPVREFWSPLVRIGNLTTRCNVPSGPVYKVAYAGELLGAKLYDGRGELLGAVEEAILEPESGKLGFYVVRPAQGEGWVLVRLGVTNIPREALAPGAALRLVLLAEPQLFWDAPRLAVIDEADDFAVQGRMRRYWGSP